MADTQNLPFLAAASMNLGDEKLIKLAREIAMDIRSRGEIIELLEISEDDFSDINANPRFQRYLRGAVEEWNSASNTSERVKIKSLAFIEEALPEFYARAHDASESLAAKTEVLKTVARFAGIGGNVVGGSTPERMVVTINLGADHQVRVEQAITTTYEEVEDRL